MSKKITHEEEKLEYGLDKEKELHLVNIYTEYHTHNYIENYDKRTLNLTFETEENERLILKLSKGDLIELENYYNEVMESEEL